MADLKYNKTIWNNGVTPLNADNLNNIESGIENLYNAIKNGEVGSNAREYITYSKLVKLVNSNSLTVGTYYEIIGYSNNDNTIAHTCNFKTEKGTKQVEAYWYKYTYPISIIVQALNNSQLNENAIYHMNGTSEYYFQCKYSLLGTKYKWNDISKNGVVYWLKDDHNNEAPYDFNSIVFNMKSYGDNAIKTALFSYYDSDKGTMLNNIRAVYYKLSNIASGDEFYLGIHDNIIKPRIDDSTTGNTEAIYDLPCIVFVEEDSSVWGERN